MADAALPQPAGRRRRAAAALDLKRQKGFGTAALLCLVFLYAPIAVLVLFSFNAARSISAWAGFSLEWYELAFRNQGLQDAAIISIKVAVLATIAATVIATLAALATTRTRSWKGLGASYMLINMPLMVPEIVTAVATLVFFALLVDLFGLQFGLMKLVLAHTVFCIPFAYMPIRARIEDMDNTLEQAAADLYARPWQTFRRVTLPLLVPGITAGATLSFVVSFDDFTISQLVAGPGETTLPMYIWSSLRRGLTPELNAMSALLLVISILLVSLSFLIARGRR